MKFPANIHKELKNYIYALYDSADDSGLPFYVGRGVGDRVFSHLKESHNEEVQIRIDGIRDKGREPVIKIILHGLSAQEAIAGETASIAMLGKGNLANKVKGAGSSLTKVSPRELIDHYNAKPVVINHKVVMIIRNPWNPDLPEQIHYDLTRSAWKLGKKKDFAEYALLVHQGVVKKIYTIANWYLDGTTFHSRNNPDPNNQNYQKDFVIRNRYEFVGRLLDPSDPISKLYIGKSVKKYLRSSGSPCHYSYNGKGEIYNFNETGKIVNL
ncbi:MAG: hypothetical protein O3A15_08945 [Proteobacteria bacterium]|nr:hypothetical protein [Pseudomonadota bacterium]